MRREVWAAGVLVSVEEGPEPVPDVVSARQLKRALLDAGLLDAIDFWVTTQSRAVQLDWATAGEYRRDHPMLTAAAGSFGLSAAQVDALFVAAGQIA